MRSADYLYACFSGLPKGAIDPGAFVGLRVDVNHSRDGQAQSDDYGFFVGEDGDVQTVAGDGAGGFSAAGPGGLIGQVSAGATVWNAELRIDKATLGGWDHHNNLREGLGRQCTSIDKPIAGLIADLKQRDMLKDTLILWGGEFGRGSGYDNEPYNGRGHNGGGYTMFMAGGGVKGGFTYGSTNEMGNTAETGIIGTHDLHATVLHLLGINHERLTYRYAGRNFRLTDVAGEVAKDIIA